MQGMSVSDAISTRRSRRVISPEPIDDDDVSDLLTAMRLAPSCNNNQPWNVVVVRSKDSLARLKESLTRGNSWALPSPLIFAVCSKRTDDCILSDDRDYHLFDSGLAVGELLLQATAKGLIAHPIAGYDPLKAKDALGIPEIYVLITLVICGSPGSDASMLSEKQLAHEAERPARKPLEENFFFDGWNQ